MMRPLPLARLADYAAFFPGPHLAYVCASIGAGNTEAQLWEITHAAAPPLLLLWDQGNNVFYWAGPPDLAAESLPDAEAWLAPLAEWVAGTLRPLALAEAAPFFRTAATAPALASLLPSLFAGVELHPYPIYLYAACAPPPRVAAPPGVTLIPITRDLLMRDDLANTAEVCAEIHWMWPSVERFLAAGFGVAACTETAVVGWCTAEYVGPTACGIGITTAPSHRRMGIATAAATCFLDEARRQGLTAYWECNQSNLASARLAEKVGLTRVAAEEHWCGHCDG